MDTRVVLGLGGVALLAGSLVFVLGAGQPAAPTAPPAPARAPAAPAPAAPAANPAAPAAEDPNAAFMVDGKIYGEFRFGWKEPIAKPAGALRLATYNVENLFLTSTDPQRQPIKPVEHLKSVAETIRRIDADVLALQEIQSLEALTQFRDTYLADMGYAYIESRDAGDDRGIENAVLSRFPLSEAMIWPAMPLPGTHPTGLRSEEGQRLAGQPLDFRRSPLRVTVTVPPEKSADPAAGKPYTLTLLVVHHKSGREFGYWREAESAKVLEKVREIQSADPAANVVVLGDFNALPADKSVQTYLTGGLVDVFADRTREPKWVTHESGRAIDLILVNENLQREVIAETRFILGTIARPAGVDWRSYPNPTGWASDHYPVVVDLRPSDAAAR